MKNFYYILFVMFTAFSCNLENKKPEFKQVENVQITNFTANNITITADVVVFNPNNVSIYLQNTEIDVFANDIKVSHISQTENTEILKKSDFKIPLKANFKPQELINDEASILDIINNSLKTFKDKKIDLKFVGTATFKIAGIEFNVPIEHIEVAEL